MGINDTMEKQENGNVCSLFVGLFIDGCGKILLSNKTRLETEMMKGAFV